jgi:fluoride ion exporter CrcB/FEX
MHPKVIAGGGGTVLGGAVGAIVVWIIGQWVAVPPEIAVSIATICSAVIGVAAGYFTPSPTQG